MLIYSSIALFLIGALGGVVMAVQIFNDQKPSPLLAAGHGILVATGLLMLLIAVLTATVATAIKIGLGFLVIAALGGFYLLGQHIQDKPHSKGIVVLHALLAVIGVLFLLGSVLSLI